ncbi:hypothetical protein AAVH_42811 [Aphelenchoides avenae]|nr:hypothetical protein AAVH_42811 [Aphelenchus avenae]
MTRCRGETTEIRLREPFQSADWSNAVLLRAYRPYADQAYALGPKRVTRQDPDSLYYNPTPCRWKLCANLFSAS